MEKKFDKFDLNIKTKKNRLCFSPPTKQNFEIIEAKSLLSLWKSLPSHNRCSSDEKQCLWLVFGISVFFAYFLYALWSSEYRTYSILAIIANCETLLGTANQNVTFLLLTQFWSMFIGNQSYSRRPWVVINPHLSPYICCLIRHSK